MWDERFSEPGYAYGTEPNGYLASVADRIPLGRVLCLGEGEGRNAVHLAGLGFEVTAVDASAVGLGKARALAAERGVEIRTVNSDLADFEIEPGAWSGIVSIFCHLLPEVRCRVHRSCADGLGSGGAFVLEAFTERQLQYATGGPKKAEMMMSLAGLRKELRGLRFEVGREFDRESHNGPYHDGLAAVVQVLAFKTGGGKTGEDRTRRP